MNQRSQLQTMLALFIAAFLGCAMTSRSEAQSNIIVRISFAGAAAISADTNSLAFTNEFCSPEARALENQTLDKLSRAPGNWFKDKLSAGAGDGSAQLRPLLDDFLKSEWVFEMRDAPASPEYALAIRLDAGRAQLWQNNLRSLLESWTNIKAKNVRGGWELKKDLPPNLFRIVRKGDWVIIGCGQNKLPLSQAWYHPAKIPEDKTNWLSADINWPRLGQIFPAFSPFDFSAFAVQVNGNGSNLVLHGKIHLSQPLPPLEQWQTPTNLIHEPLVSFTAARGFAPWLASQGWAKLFQLSSEPGQLFGWAVGTMPGQAYLAVPVPNATNALAQLASNLNSDTKWHNDVAPNIEVSVTSNRLSLTQIPFLVPAVQTYRGTSGDFLVGDFFPPIPRGKATPPGLLLAINRGNLVFYHWEQTAKWLRTLPELTQLVLLQTQHRELDPNSAAGRWLNTLTPALGESITEVIQTGPSELTFSRKGSSGLTAVELVALVNWLEAPNFPGCDLHVTGSQFPVLHRPFKKLSAPMPGSPPTMPH